MVFMKTLLGALFMVTLTISTQVSTKLDSKLSASLQSNRSINIMVKFKNGNKPALQSLEYTSFASRTQKVNHLVSSLKSVSQSSQQNVLNLLQSRSPYSPSSYTDIWATNELYIKGANSQLVNHLASFPEVAEIREEQIIYLEQLGLNTNSSDLSSQNMNSDVAWNLHKIEAPQAWKLLGGNNGKGITVAHIDTGVQHSHKTLKNNFREEYGWFDPITYSQLPVDKNGHGTHTMGTLAGSGGIGVAPGSQWIACRGCDKNCHESDLKACAQWILCPTLPDGTTSDCDKAPHLVSNSWGGGQGDTTYNDMIDVWKAAGIIPIFAIGNSGPKCGTANSPGDHKNVIGVGATTSQDNIWISSSRGPSVKGVIKPDISAPGHLIRSAGIANDMHYSVSSGTSMACPHVAGVVALILSHNPNLNYSQVKNILESTADTDLADAGQACGGIPPTQFPNNIYGHGRVNARKAIEKTISISAEN